MTKQQAEAKYQEAVEARRSLLDSIIRNEAALAEALRAERNARYEVEKWNRALATEGTKFETMAPVFVPFTYKAG